MSEKTTVDALTKGAKIHWKKLHNPNYLGSYSLDDGNDGYNTLTATIESIGQEDVHDVSSNSSNSVVVARLKGQKPMILNVTNMQRIQAVHGKYVNDWIGVSIVIAVEEIRVAKEWMPALRIQAPAQAKSLPVLTPDHKLWSKAKEKVGEGTEREEFEKYYTITDENWEKLCGF